MISLESTVSKLICDAKTRSVRIIDQFKQKDSENSFLIQKINAAFLIILSGQENPRFESALTFFYSSKIPHNLEYLTGFYKTGLKLIPDEFKKIVNNYSENERAEEILYPEGRGLNSEKQRTERVEKLRLRRTIKEIKPNKNPVTSPADEILFTSNVLATIPLDCGNIDNLSLSDSLKKKLKKISEEEQKYWYDHPIPIGIDTERNEAVYGLSGLEEMMKWEFDNGRISKSKKITCLLSASTTHSGLREIIKEYFEDELRKGLTPEFLNVFMITETTARRIISEVILPIAEEFLPESDTSALCEVFGVDGEYGRHYSLLKAVSAFWQVFINPEIKATFKIDLDQVFPQKELLEQTGESALDHFKTPLWGAEGTDFQGNRVRLGMIAGALVNESEISESLFTPDVKFPGKSTSPEELVFRSKLPQALSTEAEMMTRYANGESDGKNEVIQRIHVTGGTNGILIKDLREYRPFTPSLIGRAEDQAYLLSVLYSKNPVLRYLHKPGLIMRHDKNAFAGEAVKAAAAGAAVGDYLRILLFSYYAEALPWEAEKIKEAVDPFTGSFITPVPVTIVYLRFALKLAGLHQTKGGNEITDFAKSGAKRLHKTINYLSDGLNPMISRYEREKKGWDIYYDILNIAETGLKNGNKTILQHKSKAENLVDECRIDLNATL